MALNIASLSAALTQGVAPNAASQISSLARTNAMHYTADGLLGASTSDQGDELGADSISIGADLAAVRARGAGKPAAAGGSGSFENALLKAMDGVSASQGKSDDLLQKIVADPNSVDAQDVTIAMAEANMSLNLAKTILSRVVTAWKDVINTR
jgi:flagellar hook-basal body complex protein FliE